MFRILMFVLLSLFCASPAVGQTGAPNPPGRTIENVKRDNAYSYIQWLPNEPRQDNVLIRNSEFTCSHYCFVFQNNSSNITIDNVKLKQTKPQPRITGGIAIINGDNFLLKNLNIKGFDSTTKYPNADGIVLNRLPTNVSIVDSYFGFNSNGGIDSKSKGMLLDGVVSEFNGFNYRCWSDWKAGTLTSNSPKSGHIQTNQSNGIACHIVINELNVKATDAHPPIFGMTKGAYVEVKHCKIEAPADIQVVWYGSGANAKNTTLILDPASCAVNGKAVIYTPEDNGVYVVYPNNADADGDGFVLATGNVAAFGKKNTRWEFVGKVADGWRYRKITK